MQLLCNSFGPWSRARIVRLASVGLGQFALCFLLYSVARGMHETFGFDPVASARSAFVAVGAAFPLTALVSAGYVWLVRRAVFSAKGVVQGTLVIVAGGVLGCVASETVMLWDESRFIDEAARQAVAGEYDRAREWPAGGGYHLYYLAGYGCWATE